MKLHSFITCALLNLGIFSAVLADVTPGPKGGRLLESKPLRAEFFIHDDRKAEVIFYDGELKPVAPAAQTVVINAEPKAGRQTLDLEKTATGFISKAPLPEGQLYRIVVQIKETPEGKAENFRVQLNLSKCGECSRPEYACTCGH